MLRNQNRYNVNQIKQLINLNGNKINFELNFEVKSVDNSPFQALVISETNLNSDNPLEYKEVNDGHITGNIINDKGVYQNYFLLLKSDTPTECDVTIDIIDIPLNPELQKHQEEVHQRQLYYEQEMKHQSELRQRQLQQEKEIKQKNELRLQQEEQQKKQRINVFKDDNKNTGTNWVMIIGICIIVGIGLWFVYNTNKKTKSVEVPNKSLNISTEFPKSQLIEIPPVEVPQVNLDIPSANIVTDGLINDHISIPPIMTNVPFSLPTRRNEALFSKLNNYFG